MEASTPPAPTRRHLLLWGGFATLAAVFAGWFGRSRKSPVSAEPAVGSSTEAATAGTTLADPESVATELGDPATAHPVYTPLLNTEFTFIHPDEAKITARLIEVSPVREMVTAKGDFISFSLLFEARSGILRDGGVCRMSHPKLPTTDLFLSPVGRPEKDKIHLEACFTERV